MNKLTNRDVSTYLKFGFLTKPFLDAELIRRKVDIDHNSKILANPNYTKVESLFHWINHLIKMSQDKEFVQNNKFQRNAKEIWESGVAVGCSDYALLFATFARQLGWATTILATVEIDCLKTIQQGKQTRHFGHYFCECHYDGKWLLVDPANERIEQIYSLDEICLNYTILNSNKYIPYLRCIDLGKRQTIKEHNQDMDLLCNNIKLEQ